AIRVVAPAEAGAARSSAGVGAARLQRREAEIPLDYSGPGPIFDGTVAQLAVRVATPAACGAVTCDCTAVHTAQRERCEFLRGQNFGWSGAVVLRPVAQLTVRVLTPAENTTRRREAAGVCAAGCECSEAHSTGHRRWVCPVCRCAVAQLTR